MSINNFYDNFPSLFIDIGTESVKFTQPILSTTTLTKEIMKQNNNSKLSTNENDIDSLNIINSNTIFDYKKNINKISIIDILKNYNDIFIDYDEKITYDLYYNTYLKIKKFSFEPIFSGLYNDNFSSFETILNNIGNKIYKEKYFTNEKFKETPLIITQESLPLKILGKQVSKIYEILFENFETNYAILCSNAMLNLFSHNISNGIVVDLGESKTSITPIKNGFALYDNAIRSNFLSGRMMINYINQIKNNDDNNITSINLKDYLECRNELIMVDKNEEEYIFDIKNFLHIPYMYSFPEVFKFIYRKDFMITHNQIRDFINSSNKEENKIKNDESESSLHENEINNFNDREYIDVNINNNLTKVKYLDFDYKINTIYSQADPKKNIEKKIFESSNNFVNKEELSKFRQFSLSHMICSQIERFANYDMNNIEIFNNIVFTGGILNIKNIKKILSEDLKSLITDNNDKIKIYFPDISDSALGIYKGCNYISKLDNLKDLLITRDLYNEVGYENLCYNYI